MKVRARLLFSVSLAVGLASSSAFAWGPDGHRMIGELAMGNLPAELPAFLRATAAAKEVAQRTGLARRELFREGK